MHLESDGVAASNSRTLKFGKNSSSKIFKNYS